MQAGNWENQYSADDIDAMPQRFRANFINCLSGFKSANVIGTHNKTGEHNLAVVSSVFHVGANPPLLGMIMRPHTVVRDTLQNIKDTGVYTINHVSKSMIAQAHQTSARYDAGQSEFEAVGLSAVASPAGGAPYVQEAAICLAMQVKSIQVIELNQTELVIGQIMEVNIQGDWVASDGYVDIEAADGTCISGLDRYHQTQALARFAYAKPEHALKEIPVK